MRENEFEKRVQQKMEDLNLRPSEEVWVEVERRIRKEKKRRFIFWWPLLFLLLGGGVAAGIWITNKKDKTGEITLNNNNKTKLQSAPENIIIPQPVKELKDTAKSERTDNRKITAPGKQYDKETKPFFGNTASTPTPVNKLDKKRTAVIKKQKINAPVITRDKTTITDNQNKIQTNQPVVTIIAPEKQTGILKDIDKADSSNVIASSRPDAEQKDQALQQEFVLPLTDSINRESKTTTKKTKKWDWGINFSPGRSGIVKGLHFFDGPLYDASVLQTASTGSQANISSSVVRSSASVGAGLFVKRTVSKKLEFIIGFGYQYLSTKINVGSRVDSTRSINNSYSTGLSVNNFYRPSGSSANSSYTNQYHFINFSGDLSWRIINGKKIKISWENGISYNRLLGSAMLHYDRNLPGYYKDNNLLAKNQLFISTGFSVPVSRRLLINPFAAYGVTTVLKNADSSGIHFTNYGIRIRYILNKK